MYTFILVCSLSNFLLNEHDDDDDMFYVHEKCKTSDFMFFKATHLSCGG